jgi:hypothetical protein
MTPDAPRTEAPDLRDDRDTSEYDIEAEWYRRGWEAGHGTALSSATPAPLDVERLAEAYRIVESTPVTLSSSEDNELADAEWMARALAAEYARLTEAGS